MKIKKLAHQFLLNYILIFLMIASIALLGISSYYQYNTTMAERYDIDLELFEQDYEAQGLNYAISNQEFLKDDYIFILSPTREVIESTTDLFQVGYIFEEVELQELLYGDNYYNYYVFYSLDYSKLFVFNMENIDYEFTHLMTVLSIGLVIFIFLSVAFARYSSNQILFPILTLVKKVQEIGHGNYSTTIDFQASNELNILKDEINLMTEKLERETNKRKELEENRKQLIRDFSHDIRTPLTNILGYTDQLLSSDHLNDEEKKQNLEIIHQYGTSANHLINELFDLSRLELDEDNFIKEQLNLSEWLRQKLIDYYNEFEKQQIAFDCSIPEEPIVILANELYLQRLIDNLLLNAMKYNKEQLSLYVELTSSSKTYKLLIADDGIGIPDTMHTHIFDPMVRVDNSRNRSLGGTGLGLSIVKQVVEKHGWSIELQHTQTNYFNKGCTFVITIPKE